MFHVVGTETQDPTGKINKQGAESWSSDSYVPVCEEGKKNQVEIKGAFTAIKDRKGYS